DARDAQSRSIGFGEQRIDVEDRVDEDGRAGVFVSDQIRGTAEVVVDDLTQEHAPDGNTRSRCTSESLVGHAGAGVASGGLSMRRSSRMLGSAARVAVATTVKTAIPIRVGRKPIPSAIGPASAKPTGMKTKEPSAS